VLRVEQRAIDVEREETVAHRMGRFQSS
jgi:hypothetical protein